MCHRIPGLRLAMAAAFFLGCSPTASWAQAETFTATASVKTRTGAETTAPVTIVLTRLTTDKERDTIVDSLKKGGTSGVVRSLKAMDDAGYIELAARRTPVKYAYVRPVGGGRLITVIAPAPIAYLGTDLPEAKPKAGFDLALAVLQVKDGGSGFGELAPAATVRVNDTGAIQTQDYGAEVVRLTNVQAKK